MRIFILLFGLFIVVADGALVLKPDSVMNLILRYSGSLLMHVLAAGVRIVLGIVLLLYADQSRFPLTLEVLGWISLAAGLVLAVLPPARFQALIRWAFDRFGPFTRAAAMLAVLFGAFLIYAVI